MHALEVLSNEVLAVEGCRLVFAEVALVASEEHVLGRYMTSPLILKSKGSMAACEGEGTYEASVFILQMHPARNVNTLSKYIKRIFKTQPIFRLRDGFFAVFACTVF